MSAIPGLIPGLHALSLQLEAGPACDDYRLLGFNGKTFTVPAVHRYGNCRNVADYTKLCVVAEGRYSTVYKVKEKLTGEFFAMKQIRLKRDQTYIPQCCLREISNLTILKHENIANLITVAAGRELDSNFLILDYCEFKLSRVIDRVDSNLMRHSQMKHILVKTLYALDYLHRNGIFHRELTPMHIMFTADGTLKLIDFGLSRRVSSGSITPDQGLNNYKAPEVLFGADKYGAAVDMWALGCILAELIKFKMLFPGDTDLKVIKSILLFLGTPTESLWPGFSQLPIARDYKLRLQPYNRIRSTFKHQNAATIVLLTKLLSYNPKSRPTPEQCLLLPYFSNDPPMCSMEELLVTLHASIRPFRH